MKKLTTLYAVLFLMALSNFAFAKDSYLLKFYNLNGGEGEVLIKKGMSGEDFAFALSHSSTSKNSVARYSYPLSNEDAKLISKKDQDQLISVMMKILEADCVEEVKKGKPYVIAIGEGDLYDSGGIVNNEKKNGERINRRETVETLDFRNDTTFASKVQIFTYPGYILQEEKAVCRTLVKKWKLTGKRTVSLFGPEHACRQDG